jgi:putative phosphoribosyl transferase
MIFRDRADAGKRLAERLATGPFQGTGLVTGPFQGTGLRSRGWDAPVVLGLPRGGVPIAYEVARVLEAPLDVFVVRKLGVPGQEELAMGAIASGGVRVVNRDVVGALGLSPAVLDRVAAAEQLELERRERLYRGARALQPLAGRTVILVDDGLATGSTMRAAVRAVRQHGPARVVVAVPVAAAATCEELKAEVDEVVCLATPDPFLAVGRFYDDFTQTTDREVREQLRAAEDAAATRATRG